MFKITVVLRMRINGKFAKRETVFTFDNRQSFDTKLWELLQVDSYRVNEKVNTDVILTVDNGV